ncbi:DUF5017 domain-containing protein [Pedobacter sp.]
MRHVKLILGFSIAFLGICSCQKIEVEAPIFNVGAKAQTWKVGDSVKFEFIGNADVISFYSGQQGNNYDSIHPRVGEAKYSLEFNSRMNVNGQNNLSVMVSTNYNEVKTFDAAEASTWKDITSRFTLPGLSTTYLHSGKADITDLVIDKQPLYVAFRYAGKSAQPVATWQVNGMLLKQTTYQKDTAILTSALAAWSLLYSPVYESSGMAATTSLLTLKGNTNNKNTDVTGWAIARVVYPIKRVALKSDVAVGIKSYSGRMPNAYAIKYKSPGNYKAVFVAKNVHSGYIKETKKEIEIKIAP